MTDPSDPFAKMPRKKPRRDPATIDLPSRTIEDMQSASEADRITEAVAMEMAAPEAETSERVTDKPWPSDLGGTVSADEPRTPPSRGFLAPLIAAALGGFIGAGLLLASQTLKEPISDPRLIALEQQVAALPQGAPGSDVQALTARIQALEALEQRIAAAQSTAEQALNRPAPEPQDQNALTEIAQRLSTLEEQIRSTQQSSAGVRQAIETQVEDLSKRVSEGPDAVATAALRMALAQRLGNSLARGAPYAETLKALEANGTAADHLTALAPFAERGAPTASALAQSFEPLGTAILREDRAGSEGLADRLRRMAERVVKIRSVDEPGANDVASLVARIGQALDRGDVGEAVTHWEALPEPARRLSEEWASRAKARAAADAGVRALADDAIAAMTRRAP